jgi:hypothetical protein
MEREQADGTVITIMLRGDEFFFWIIDENGYLIAYNEESRNYYYAVIEGGRIVPGTQIVGRRGFVYTNRIRFDTFIPGIGFRIFPERITLTIGETTHFNVIFRPYGHSWQPPGPFEWSSSDDAVASVDGEASNLHTGGVVTANALGESVITLKTEDGQVAATCVVTVVNKHITPPRPPGGGGGGGGSRGGGGGTAPAAPPVIVAQPVTSAMATTAVNAALQAGGTAARLVNPSTIALDVLQSMNRTAGTTPLRINADTMVAGTQAVDVRLSVNPADATKEINLNASTSSPEARAVLSAFERSFGNRLSVVRFAQADDFGMQVSAAARLNPALNKDTLVFYSFNPATNRYRQITDMEYRVDANGYLHFSTGDGGSVIITDSLLAKR